MPVNGEFYINNLNKDFWLREFDAWNKKGKLIDNDIVGFYADGPFRDAQTFTLAPSVYAVNYSPALSPSVSRASCASPPTGAVDVVFTDDLPAYLALGERAIMTAHWEPGTTEATLTFLTATIAAHSSVYAVFPTDNDPTFAIVSIYMGGEPT